MQKKLFLAAIAASMMALVACGGSADDQYKPMDLPDEKPLEAEMVADFSQGESEEIFASNGWSNGGVFNCVWKKENITYSDGQMHLNLKKENAVDGDKTYPNTSGEARSHKLYGYGEFEVRMKISDEVGTVSTFFVYTDKWNSTDGTPNEHNEIDIEFLGKDPYKVQFNYFVGHNGEYGAGGHEKLINLGFDASKDFHNYGFRWEENKITWFVDGKAVYQVNKDANNPELPSMPGRIMTSYWPHTGGQWSGDYKGETDKTVDYEWIKAKAPTSYADGEEPVPPTQEHDWSKVEPTAVTFDTARKDLYTLNESEGVTTVTYSEAGQWANLTAANLASALNENDAINLTLKNGSAKESVVRVDVQGSTKVGNSDCLNTSATAAGHSEIYTDTNWGGSKITLAAGEEVEFIINYDVATDKGRATNLLLFIDSIQDNLVAHQGGSISISKVRLAKLGSGDAPVNPGVDFDWSLVAAINPDSSWANEPYKNEDIAGGATFSYKGASGWACAGFTINNAPVEANAMKITIKNNSELASDIRIDIQGALKQAPYDKYILNKSAFAIGHDEVSTSDGSYITLAAGEEVDLVIIYDTANETGPLSGLTIFMDSLQASAKDEAERSVTFTNLKFATIA